MASEHPQEFVTTAPRFDSQSGWSTGYALAKDNGPGVVVGPGRDNPNGFAQTFLTSPGAQYKVVARATSVEPTIGRGAIQINWQDAHGNFVGLTQYFFDLSPTETAHEKIAVTPSKAVRGELFVLPGGSLDVVRYTEMSVARLSPFQDFQSYVFFGIPGNAILIALFFAAVILVFKRQASKYFLTGFGDNDQTEARWMRWMFPALAFVLSGVPFIFLEKPYEEHYDSHWHQSSIESVMRWKVPSLDLGGDPLHNFGVHHAINPQLSPTFQFGWMFGQDHRIQLEGAFQSMVFFALLFQLCRLSGARRNDAAAISLIAVFYLCVPFLTGAAGLTANATLGLLWREGALAALASFLCFASTGFPGVTRTAWHLSALGLCFTILWIFLTFPELIAFFAVSTFGLCGGALLGSESKKEVIYKVIASAVIFGVLLALHLHNFILNLYVYTPQIYFSTLKAGDLSVYFNQCTFLLQITKEAPVPLYVFFGLSATGAGIALRFGNRFARRIVLAAVSLELSILLLSALNALLKFVPVCFFYVELMGISVAALLAGLGIWSLMRVALWAIYRIVPCIGYPNERPPTPLLNSLAYVSLLVSVAFVIHTLYNSGDHQGILWPPRTTTTPARIQAEALAVRPGEAFKGRGAMLMPMAAPSGTVDWASSVFPLLSNKLQAGIHSDLMIDAEASDIPMVNEYGHWYSPAMLSLMAAAFYDPADPIGRAAQVPRRFRVNLARLLGISLVISDQPLPGQNQLFQGTVLGHPIYIHGVADVNLGQYSPTRTVAAKDAHEIFNQLQAHEFDGQTLAVVEQQIDGDLVSAETLAVRLDRGPKIHVEAQSEGRSLLVLPFEFSHCLRIDGVGVEQLMPVNLAQIGVIIRGRATFDIAYHYGLFAGTSCRRLDLERIKALDLEDAATGRLFRDSRLPASRSAELR